MGTGVLMIALAAVPAIAYGQGLTDACTVSVLNRTAPVDADGVWVLPNVPTWSGPVRVRATCVDEGVTRSGQSDWFTVPPNGVIRVGEVAFDVAEPVPASLAVSAPAVRLTAAGETVQVTTVASYPDGSIVEVTAADAGTIYTSSNPAVAEVSPDGVVTAEQSGVVLLTATNEGTLAVLRLEVIIGADSDGDGLPDDWEIANGFDPNNGSDAIDDPDEDGLSTFFEFGLGTDPSLGDTDGDGLLDGDEVTTVGTNPLLRDTDGDGVPDGLELEADSDPLDPQSVNLAPILAGLSVAPESFTLVFNTIFGEASRLLAVTATLIDGTTLDATASRYGTAYQSSNLAVASFGAEAGRVFAGANGSATITVSNGSFTAESLVQVESFSPRPLSFVALPGSPNAVAVSEGHAYVACGSAGLQVVDVADPAAPQRIGALSVPGLAYEVAVEGETAFVAAGAGGLLVVDVATPSSPTVLATVPTPSPALDVAVSGGIAHVVDGAGLRVVDVSVPAAPSLLGGLQLLGRARGVSVEDGLAVIAAEAAGVHVVDVSDPEDPGLIGSTPTRPNGTSDASAAVLLDRVVYVADGARSLGGIKIVDVSVPSTPVVVGASSDAFGLNDVAVEGRFAFTADYFFVNAVPIFNVAARPPGFAAVIDFRTLPQSRDDNGLGVAVEDGLVYLAADRLRGRRFNANGNGGLYIGRYARAEEEPAEPQPPVVELVSPAPGTEVRERAFLTVEATASDDVRVDRVEFSIGGELVATDPAPLYRARIQVPFGAGSVVLGATAYDSAGNSTVAEPVELTVLEDPRPTVRLLTPVAGQRAVEGRTFEVAAEATDDLQVDRVDFLIDGVVVATDAFSPYRMHLPVPATASFTVAAVAYDNVGQFDTSETVSVPVDPDAPPAVTILSPADGDEVTEGAVVWVSVGAIDDFGLVDVTVAVDGEPAASRSAPPFDIPVRVPSGVLSVTIAAAATDDRDQTSVTEELELTVIADPLTTVEGQVVDAAGSGVAGAEVTCAGVGGTSGVDGSFVVPGVPTAAGRIGCSAAVVVDGEVLSGATEPVPPVLGGATDVGTLPVLPQLLYAGTDLFGAGRLLVLDESTGRFLPWSEAIPPAGLGGLAFDLAGGLWATTFDAGVIEDVRAGGVRRLAEPGISGGSGGSELLQIDPDAGAVLAQVGPVVDGAGSTVSVDDLAYDALAQRLLGIDAEPFGESTVFTIDPSTAVAAPLATGWSLSSAAVALGSDGLLYLVGIVDGQQPPDELTAGPREPGGPRVVVAAGLPFGTFRVWAIDPADGQVVWESPIDAVPPAGVSGAVEEGSGSLLVASGHALYRLDLGTLELTEIEVDTESASGGLTALARRPLAAPPVVTDVAGFVLDEADAPVSAVPVATIGAAGSSGQDGQFTLPGVVVRSGRVRVLAESLGEIRFSEAVAPVAGGVTDIGIVRVGARTCVNGRLIYFESPGNVCISGPALGVINLAVLSDDEGEWVPAGTVEPAPDGSFCAQLRSGGIYLAWQDVECSCGVSSFCERVFELTGPTAGGQCSEPSPLCEELGDLALDCFPSCQSD